MNKIIYNNLMKRKILTLTIIIALACPLVANASNYFEDGRILFEKRNYKGAEICFQLALKKNPNNVDFRYYHALSLVNLGQLTEAEKDYQKIIQLSPLSTAAKLSSIGLVKIQDYRKFLKRNNGYHVISDENSLASLSDNYIYNALINGKVVRWSPSKFPLKIYVQKTSTQSSYASIVQDALSLWARAIGGKLSYKFVKNQNDANIQISFLSSIQPLKNSKKPEGGYISGLTTPQVAKNQLKSVTVQFATSTPSGRLFSDAEIYNTAVHELGHALGIYGHSDRKTDIMYPLANEDKSKKLNLSTRDINTVKLLYSLDSDISDLSAEISKYTSGKNSVILGDNQKRQNKKMQEALNYVKLVPDHPLSWTSLGTEYLNNKKYSSAITSYKKALSIDPTYTQAREGLVQTYISSNDTTNALLELNKLSANDPKNIKYAYNTAILYIKENKTEKAMESINKIIAQNPQAKDDEAIKSLISQIEANKIQN